MDYQEIIAGTVGKENTFGTCVGRVKAGAMSFARYSTDDRRGVVRGYTGAGRFTDDPLETFGGAGVAEIPQLQKLLKYICREGFEHHVAANFSDVSKADARGRALSWLGEPLSSRARRLSQLTSILTGVDRLLSTPCSSIARALAEGNCNHEQENRQRAWS